jgi:hypothetical protein
VDLADGNLDAKFFEYAEEVFRVGLVFFLGVVVVRLGRFAEEVERGIFVITDCLGGIGIPGGSALTLGAAAAGGGGSG